MTMPLKPNDLVTALTPLLAFFDEIANLRAEMRDAVDTKRRTQLQSSITDAMARLRAVSIAPFTRRDLRKRRKNGVFTKPCSRRAQCPQGHSTQWERNRHR